MASKFGRSTNSKLHGAHFVAATGAISDVISNRIRPSRCRSGADAHLWRAAKGRQGATVEVERAGDLGIDAVRCPDLGSLGNPVPDVVVAHLAAGDAAWIPAGQPAYAGSYGEQLTGAGVRDSLYWPQ